MLLNSQFGCLNTVSVSHLTVSVEFLTAPVLFTVRYTNDCGLNKVKICSLLAANTSLPVS